MRESVRSVVARPYRVGVALLGALAVVVGVSATMASASPSHMSGMTSTTHQRAVAGDTLGWFGGKTVLFHYTKNFVCNEPPSSKAPTQCESGAKFQSMPSRQFDPLYVLVPLGFTPRTATLQCPDAGNCVDHPHTIDLTRVLGAGTGQALLPPHSHVIDDNNMGKAEWWDVVVIGVANQASWDRIVTGKKLATVRHLQGQRNSGVTPDIPTNLFLYFSVRPIR